MAGRRPGRSASAAATASPTSRRAKKSGQHDAAGAAHIGGVHMQQLDRGDGDARRPGAHKLAARCRRGSDPSGRCCSLPRAGPRRRPARRSITSTRMRMPSYSKAASKIAGTRASSIKAAVRATACACCQGSSATSTPPGNSRCALRPISCPMSIGEPGAGVLVGLWFVHDQPQAARALQAGDVARLGEMLTGQRRLRVDSLVMVQRRRHRNRKMLRRRLATSVSDALPVNSHQPS